MSTPSSTIGFCGVLLESKRIINAHSRHFLALSVLFLLPLSFSIIVYPTLEQALSQSPHNNQPLTLLRHPSQSSTKTLNLLLIYLLFVFSISHCALATITHSVYHGFYGRPVKLLSSIISLSKSLIPLAITFACSQFVVFLVIAVFGILGVLVIRGIELLGLQLSYDSPYAIALGLFGFGAIIIVVGYLQVIWSLAGVVVVIESSWGLAPLRRSKNLIQGMRKVSLSLLLFFEFFVFLLVWSSSSTVADMGGTADGWKSWAFVVQTVVSSAFVTLFMLHYLAAHTVLYMYCKAYHGDLAWEIVEEFSTEYVFLPFDGEKVPHLVSVVLP